MMDTLLVESLERRFVRMKRRCLDDNSVGSARAQGEAAGIGGRRGEGNRTRGPTLSPPVRGQGDGKGRGKIVVQIKIKTLPPP